MLQNIDSNPASSGASPLPDKDLEHFVDSEPVDEEPLTWEASYAIALALRRHHPKVNLAEVSLGMIFQWTVALPEFCDDRELANEAILAAIYQEWFEEELRL